MDRAARGRSMGENSMIDFSNQYHRQCCWLVGGAVAGIGLLLVSPHDLWIMLIFNLTLFACWNDL